MRGRVAVEKLGGGRDGVEVAVVVLVRLLVVKL